MINVFEKFKKQEQEQYSMEQDIEYQFARLSDMLADIPPEDERFKLVEERMRAFVGMKKDLHSIDTESEDKKEAGYVIGRLIDGITDPKTIATLLQVGIATVSFIWWGSVCMSYDFDGKIPPYKMLGFGPRPPKAF